MMMFLLLAVLIALFLIIKRDKSNTIDFMGKGPCSRFHKSTDKERVQGSEQPHKQGDEHPVVQVVGMVCNLIGTLFKYWLKFLFFTFLMGLVILFFCVLLGR